MQEHGQAVLLVVIMLTRIHGQTQLAQVSLLNLKVLNFVLLRTQILVLIARLKLQLTVL
ncbi:hypothetical protein D3C76_1629080 [compost metagenome]